MLGNLDIPKNRYNFAVENNTAGWSSGSSLGS